MFKAQTRGKSLKKLRKPASLPQESEADQTFTEDLDYCKKTAGRQDYPQRIDHDTVVRQSAWA